MVVRRGKTAKTLIDDPVHALEISRPLISLKRQAALRIPDLLFFPEAPPERHNGRDQDRIAGFISPAKQRPKHQVDIIPDRRGNVFPQFERSALQQPGGVLRHAHLRNLPVVVHHRRGNHKSTVTAQNPVGPPEMVGRHLPQQDQFLVLVAHVLAYPCQRKFLS